jgi:hypothetical protein
MRESFDDQLRIKLCILTSDQSLLITTQIKSQINFRMAAMLLFYILQKQLHRQMMQILQSSFHIRHYRNMHHASLVSIQPDRFARSAYWYYRLLEIKTKWQYNGLQCHKESRKKKFSTSYKVKRGIQGRITIAWQFHKPNKTKHELNYQKVLSDLPKKARKGSGQDIIYKSIPLKYT